MDIKLKDLIYFYDDYENKSPLKLFLYMFISFGFYIINWIYFTNKKLEEIDEISPDPKRGSIILFFFPVIWILLIYILRKVIFRKEHLFLEIFNIVGWGFIIFLSLKYIFDFCISFGKVTGSSGIIWYLSIYPGYLAIILMFFEFYWTAPLLFFTIITIPSMQSFMNLRAKQIKLKKARDYFNTMERAIQSY